MDEDVLIVNPCVYCKKQINAEEYLQCLQCNGFVHVKCLKHSGTPGDILGDVFFDLTCAKCMLLRYDGPSSSNMVIREKFVRQKISWVMVIVLALYNLSIKTNGLSRRGYFHWRTHIANFIEKNWEYLFKASTKRRKNFFGTISGTLSHYQSDFWKSGILQFGENGWWKLTFPNKTPRAIYKIYEHKLAERPNNKRNEQAAGTAPEDISYSSADSSSDNDAPDVKRPRTNKSIEKKYILKANDCSRTIPYMGCKPKFFQANNRRNGSPEEFNTVQTNLMDFLAENLNYNDFDIFNNLSNITAEPLLEPRNDLLPLIEANNNIIIDNNTNLFDLSNIKNEPQDLSDSQQSDKFDGNSNDSNTDDFNDDDNENDDEEDDDGDDEDDEDESCKPRIVQITNFQQIEIDDASKKATNEKYIKKKTKESHDKLKKTVIEIKKKIKEQEEKDEQAVLEDTSILSVCKPSAFTKLALRNWPWGLNKNNEEIQLVSRVLTNPLETNERLVMISAHEEKELLQKLHKVFALEKKLKLVIPYYIQRFYRKLCLREWKRDHGKSVFNLDENLDPQRRIIELNHKVKHIIDRYQLIATTPEENLTTFHARIAGAFQYECFESPYSHRILPPVIKRSDNCFPQWLKIMCELQFTCNGVPPKRAPIDFCYVRPNHIAAVNALLQSEFWSGIDMSECLSYPDYSVVALYKKLVVGCGFLVPDVGYNEAYISFMAVRPAWQRSGIGTFMLYHLIQTCMTKDITLHVSATNPAIVLYQKFGFKIEEVIVNFYDRYLPVDSKHSRNAFFLRLMR